MNLKEAIQIYRKHYTCCGRVFSCNLRCKKCRFYTDYDEFVRAHNYIQKLIDNEEKFDLNIIIGERSSGKKYYTCHAKPEDFKK